MVRLMRDSVNIANAALFGLKEDLKLGGTEYNTALVILCGFTYHPSELERN